MSKRRGSKCPDCNGPHGRGYHLCTRPYVNAPTEEVPSGDAIWIAELPTYDTPAKILRLVLDNVVYLTDGYYRDLGDAMARQAEKVLADDGASSPEGGPTV